MENNLWNAINSLGLLVLCFLLWRVTHFWEKHLGDTSPEQYGVSSLANALRSFETDVISPSEEEERAQRYAEEMMLRNGSHGEN